MVRATKYHGTGNDFVLIDAADPVVDRRALGMALCDRETGLAGPDGTTVGADGVLFCALDADSQPPRVSMTLVQPDGSVAEMCGNGARCAAMWTAERTGADEVLVETEAGTRRAVVEADGTVTIEMGRPSFDPAAVPVDSPEPWIERSVAGVSVTAVNTGVPHAVAFVDDVADIDVETVAPPIRHADVFPAGTNVTFASPRGEGYAQRTFERGVEGETDSCGTGAVAIAAVAAELGRIDPSSRVPIWPPGGQLWVTLHHDDEARLHGPAVREFRTDIAPEDWA